MFICYMCGSQYNVHGSVPIFCDNINCKNTDAIVGFIEPAQLIGESRFRVTTYPINMPLSDYINPADLIHPEWFKEFKAEQKALYDNTPSVKEAFFEWNRNREYFFSCLE